MSTGVQGTAQHAQKLRIDTIKPKLCAFWLPSLHSGTELQQNRAAEDSLICGAPNKVTVHGPVLQLTGGYSVQLSAESGSVGREGAVCFHTADGLTHKVPQGRFPPPTNCSVPAQITAG